MNWEIGKVKMTKQGKICLGIFFAVMTVFTIVSCNGGESKAIRTAKSLVFFSDTYESQYTLSDVVDTAFSDVTWSAQKIEGEWYVTLNGKLANTDNLPSEAKQMISLYKSWGIDFSKFIYSFDFHLQGTAGELYGGGTYYDGEYSESETSSAIRNLRLLYLIHDNEMNK